MAAARRAGAAEIVDPRPFVTGTIAEVFEKYDVGPVVPAEDYSLGQPRELERAIAATPCDTIVIGTPTGSFLGAESDSGDRDQTHG